ncbi:cytochrome b [Parasedimentitalea maritima]|uniref:Cytochrome B n=1 Tax=Parasedimentitalea maritima TaxID=2578117 RepID=A0A6A4RD73_9RHOB|nr:cytochrome b/b6 domain-containing protein [Zongyanglinia marina]KAE9627670.1 cytochrome B [Zongyanglinia marina]
MNRRSAVKWMHWLCLGLIAYFYLVEPDENKADPGLGLSTHAGVGLILSVIVALWLAFYLTKGLMGRPGPKLPSWAKGFHHLSHKTLQYGVAVVVASGAVAGLVAPFAIRAFGTVPINPAFGSKWLHELAEELHEIVFDGLIIVILAHAAFHIWRHYWLKDNALRIMVPRVLHKYL